MLQLKNWKVQIKFLDWYRLNRKAARMHNGIEVILISGIFTLVFYELSIFLAAFNSNYIIMFKDLLLSLILCLVLTSCGTTSFFPSEDSFVEVVDDISLYPIGQPAIEPEKVILKGSVIKYGNRSSLPVVFTSDTDGPYKTKKRLRYVKKSSRSKKSISSSSSTSTLTGANASASTAGDSYSSLTYSIKTLPYDPAKNYIRGTRGGCYYLSASGGKVYVERSYCGSTIDYTPTPLYSAPQSNSSYKSKSSAGTTHVKGHYRTSKSGKRTYVKPHTRRRN